MKGKISSVFLNGILIIALVCWFAYLAIGLFGSTDYSSGMLERNSYRELYTVQLSGTDAEDSKYTGEYICQIEKRDKEYNINWIIIDDEKYEIILEDDNFKPWLYTNIDTELGYFELEVLECQHEPSFIFDIRFTALLIISLIMFWRIFIKRNL